MDSKTTPGCDLNAVRGEGRAAARKASAYARQLGAELLVIADAAEAYSDRSLRDVIAQSNESALLLTDALEAFHRIAYGTG